MKNDKKQPDSLGAKLKALRALKAATLADVSSAVEIAEKDLRAFESDRQTPSEDELILLVRYYELDEAKSMQLWKTAGYTGSPTNERYFELNAAPDEPQAPVQSFMPEHMSIGIMLQDPRVMYTDMAQVSLNDHGLVLNFMQTAGKDKPTAVARVGMSREHALSVIAMLQKTLKESDIQRQLKSNKSTATVKPAKKSSQQKTQKPQTDSPKDTQ